MSPEIAAALPTVSRDGHTYTFTVRSGFRFSPPSNAAVTAQTFKYSIERALSQLGANAPALTLASDILGVRAFRAGTTQHISGVSVRGDTLAITLTRPAPDFPERVATSYFARADRHADRRKRAVKTQSHPPARTTSVATAPEWSQSCGATRTTTAPGPAGLTGSSFAKRSHSRT